MKLPFVKPKEEPPPEPEPEKEEPRQERIRVTYPTAQLEANIKETMDRIDRDISDYSFKTREGDVAAGDRIETIICVHANKIAGLLLTQTPEIALRLRKGIRKLSDRKNGKEFLEDAMFLIGSALSQTVWQGRKAPGLNLDDGKGLEAAMGWEPDSPD